MSRLERTISGWLSLERIELTGSSVSVSVSPAQSSPGVVQIGLSRTR